jgi:hypothetical protein
MEPTVFPETTVNNYQPKLYNIPDERGPPAMKGKVVPMPKDKTIKTEAKFRGS